MKRGNFSPPVKYKRTMSNSAAATQLAGQAGIALTMHSAAIMIIPDALGCPQRTGVKTVASELENGAGN